MSSAINVGLATALAVQGVAATYRRGSTEATIAALPAKSKEAFIGADGAVVQSSDRDFIIAASSIREDFNAPLEGDEIDVDYGGRSQTYQLCTLSDGSRAWQFLPGNEFIRISFKRVIDSGSEGGSDPPPIPDSSDESSGTITGNGSDYEFVINHKLNKKYITLTFFDSDDEACIVEHWGVTDANNARVWFESPLTHGMRLTWVARR